ncbi:hypothetical protein ID866_9252, partial [Astraeus odoratus]
MGHRVVDGADDVGCIMDFLWAWLNAVNTRCIYYRLKPSKSDPDNLTMCPVLDFANHSPDRSNMSPGPTKADIWNVAPVPMIGEGLRFFSLDNTTIQENDEILLTYGPHSNKTLFVEYGFVIGTQGTTTVPQGEVDVQDIIEEKIAGGRYGYLVKDLLVAESYWGDWVMFSGPDHAQPSWRLIMTLRLHNLLATLDPATEDAIQLWRNVVAGKQERVSDGNERSCRESVLHTCEAIINRARRSLEVTVGHLHVQHHIRALWAE